jgi:uncharacterized protein
MRARSALVLSLLELGLLVVAFAATACGSPSPAGSAPSPSAPASPPSGPAATATASPGRPVTFPAADGTTLTGRVYGNGTTAVVLSNMGDNDPTAWEGFAPTLADAGYTVLSYAYRYPVRTANLDAAKASGAVDDLAGAAAYVRQQGARRLVLVGASLGGMATAKLAARLRADAVVVIASPGDRQAAFQLRVEPAELTAITAPKLFVASDDDPNVDIAETRALFDQAREPKQWQSYPSTAHGTLLFGTAHGDALRQRLVDFVTAAVPA